MQTYSEFRPTALDCRGLALDNQQDWVVLPVGRNRDSNALDESNFYTALEIMGGESETVEVHRFGHWACGWFEIIIAHPSLAAEVEKMEDALADYPVLDDDDLSEREWEAACETWGFMSLRDRIDLCKRAWVSILAARRDEPDYSLMDYLRD